MQLYWTPASRRDLLRLHDFLRTESPRAAAKVLMKLTEAANKLMELPRTGYVQEAYLPRDVRSLIVGDYELRYEIVGSLLAILRIWHTREDR